MSVRIESGDCLDVIPRLVAEGVVVDAVVTDPPYHLLPTSKRFGPGQKAPQGGTDGSYTRLSGGFMNQTWDGGDIAFRPETWATIASVLRPGGFLLAFGGTRTSHRVICAIEDAGLVIQDKIFWCFGSGFPKRRDMLKPAYEDICVAYKPGGKRTLQVDECRIGNGTSRRSTTGGMGRKASPIYGQFNRQNVESFTTRDGRWPANLVHDGSDEVLALFPNSAGQQGDVRGTEPSRAFYGKLRPLPFKTRAGDGGSAARFFYCAKAGAEDRFGSRHPTVKPIELLKWLVPLVTPKGGVVLDPFAGSGTTGAAAIATGGNAILIEREEAYVADIRERLAFYEGDGRHSLAAKARSRRDVAGPLL